MEMTEMQKRQFDLFKQMVETDVSDKVEKKNELDYLSWAWAWSYFKTNCSDATYEVCQFTNPITGVTRDYLEDEELGFMVHTKVTAQGLTYEMWLPVMDGANQAMKRKPYTYKVKKMEYVNGKKKWNGDFEDRTVESCTMFDINKTIMRCLTKNLAMFGLGLKLYSGEDLPSIVAVPCTAEQVKEMRELNVNEFNTCKYYNVTKLEDLTSEQADFVITSKKAAAKKTEKQGEQK